MKAIDSTAIRVLCVDDHQIILDGVMLILDRESDIHVVGSAATPSEAVQAYQRLRPDIVLMDLQQNATSAVSTMAGIREIDPSARIIVLTMLRGDEDIARALNAGAATYILKDTVTGELVHFIREVYAGRRVLPRGVQARLAERDISPSLSPRETEVLDLVSHGLHDWEIANRLGITRYTVQVHVKRILQKLGTKDRTAAAVVGLRRGIIHLN